MGREPSYWEYVKAAFHLKPRLPGCGALPLNYIFLVGLGILGGAGMLAAVPVGVATWLLGAAGELLYLYLLSSNPRFQRYVRAQWQHRQQQAAEQQRAAALAQLSQRSRERFRALEQRCSSLQSLSQAGAGGTGGIDSWHLAGLHQLLWIFIRLLASQETLQRYLSTGASQEIERQIQALERDLAQADWTPAVRKSKQSTLDILKRRFERIQSAQEQVQFIESELQRIEQQVSLLQEEALLHRDPAFLSGRIDAVTETLGETSEWIRMNAEFLGNLEEGLPAPVAVEGGGR